MFYKHSMNLLKPFFTISVITMCSRILGFIRDTTIARIFGVSIITDAFFIAFKLPNLLRRIFAEGAFYQVFLPILSEYQNNKSIEVIKIFVARVLGSLIAILWIVIIVGLITAPWVIMMVVPGFFSASVEKLSITITMFRIMLPYIFFISLASLMSAILNVWNFFLIPAVIPVFLNITMIGFMLFSEYIYSYVSVIGLSWSVIIGGLVQLIYCMVFLKKVNMLVFPKIKVFDDQVYRIYRAMAPALIAIFSSHVSLIINTILASFLRNGSISWMYYADRLVELPIGVFGIALSTILLPHLSWFNVIKNNDHYFQLMNWGMKLCFLFSLPSAIILGVFSEPLIITLFKYGKFSDFDVTMTQHSVVVYSIGLPGLMLVKVLTSGFYALRDVNTPARLVVLTIVFSQLLNLICIDCLQHVAFSVSASISAWLHAGLLYWKLRTRHFFKLQFGWLLFFYQLIIASFIMYSVCIFLVVLVVNWEYSNLFYRLIKITGLLIIGISSYFVVLWYLGFRIRNFIVLNRNVHSFNK